MTMAETHVFRNYHTHTTRCLHAQNTDEEYVVAAIEAGYQVLGFADHTPWPYPNGFASGIRMKVSQLEDYVSSLRALRQRYQERIRIVIGLECECFPQYFPWLVKVRDELELDYLIFGNHLSDEHEGDSFMMHSRTHDDLRRYEELAITGMESGLFAYFAHPDLLFCDYPAFDDVCADICRSICQTALRLHLPLEYNLQGVRYLQNGREAGIGYPNDCFWQIAAEIGNTAIIGVDAHSAAAISDTKSFVTARSRLQQWGLTVIDGLMGLK